jgi:hypothetical protein
VLESTLFTLLRPVQQYSTQTPFESGQRLQTVKRILTFIRGWDKLRAQASDLNSLQETPPDYSQIQSTFYNTSSSGPITVQVDPLRGDTLAKLVEERQIPLEEHLSILHRIRVQTSEGPRRQQLLRIRLLALSTYRELRLTSHG